MTARELVEWRAYERIAGPILATDRIDAGIARLSFVLTSGAESPDQFMPEWDAQAAAEREAQRPQQTPEQMIATFRAMTKKKKPKPKPKRKAKAK